MTGTNRSAPGSGKNEKKKWLLAVEPGATWSERSAKIFRDWGRGVAAAGLETEAEWLDREAHRRFTGSAEQPHFCAFLTVFAELGLDPATLGSPDAMQVAPLALAPQLVFDRIRSEPGRITPGLKKTTLWRAREGLDAASWQARYRAHAELVPSVHASAWRYCQNLIEEAPNDLPYQAVSELWWPTEEDLLERFYASQEARRLVADDTRGFIDIACAVQVVTRHERLAPGG